MALNSGYSIVRSFPPPVLDVQMDKKERARLKKSLLSMLDLKIKYHRKSLFSDWKFLQSFKPLLSQFTANEKDFFIEKITESISNGLTAPTYDPLLQHVFQSKIYYVVHPHVKNWFGLEYNAVSDITVARNENTFTTIILSSEPFVNKTQTSVDGSFYYAVVEEASREITNKALEERRNFFNGIVSWNLVGGDSYRANLNINAQQSARRFFSSHNTGPNYEAIWEDGQSAGVVIVGSNLRHFSRTLLENYLSYFRSEGFEFSSLPVDDFKAFFLQQVSDCEIDYFLKEAHGDGDERNVMRVDVENNILKGVRNADEGKTEVVYLVFPKVFYFGDPKTVLISHDDLGLAVRQRERKGCGEVTYFNTGCWSHVKARYEIESINSPLFLNIPSTSMSDTFLDEEGDSIRGLIDSFRKGRNFEGFREVLKKNEGYAARKL